ncbi:hypothetical protein GH714_034660 [Hevea brasiliensis]|uniref:Uncharacterized protein n=1 Tax=Hevea brasiliensis TaxID=3981 RepID=A0A6A6MFG6_HEVBR|nr:hypothetical protein GH714_034660 [Hevea brasiliensis]
MDNTTAANRKRGRKGIDDAIAGAILRMAAASRLKTAAIKQISERYSIADCIKELDAMQGVEEGVYFALDLFDNPNAREIFLSLKGDKRMICLMASMCRVYSFKNMQAVQHKKGVIVNKDLRLVMRKEITTQTRKRCRSATHRQETV